MFAIIFEYVVMYYHLCFTSCLVALGVGSFHFAVSSAKLTRSGLRVINKSLKVETNRLIATKRVDKFIRIHSISKQLRKFRLNKCSKNAKFYSILFQISFGFFGNFSTYNYGQFHMVYTGRQWYIVIDSNRNS